jgi:LacI family transcriptional regulator
MGIVQGKGIKVPEEISFVGFTNGMLSQYASPGLTSVAQHGDRMGEVAAKMLINRVEQELKSEIEIPFRTEVIKGSLIERESTIN